MPRSTRRNFLKTTAAAGLGASMAPAVLSSGVLGQEKLRIGVVGVNNRGRANLDGVQGEHIAALCDVDANYLAEAGKRFPEAQTFRDWREMLETAKLDAVVCSTPDHQHAPVTLAALRRGLHTYTEKPLAHTVEEARRMAEVAKEKNLVTQMGTQIHAGANYRRVTEAIQSGVLGTVRQAHVFCNKNWGGGAPPSGEHEVPANLDWNLWLGPAPDRPYAPGYHPANWRRYWDFGGGTLADMACHYMDLPFWALGLRHPISVEAEGEDLDNGSCPQWSGVRWEFPQEGARPPVTLTWHDGNHFPEARKKWGCEGWGSGVLFVGDEGAMIADYGRFVLLPEEKFAGWQAPAQTIPNSVGHYREWIEACKTGGKTTCNFDYSGALSETVLLGTVGYRVGTKLSWDASTLTATGHADAHRMIRKPYREGWQL